MYLHYNCVVVAPSSQQVPEVILQHLVAIFYVFLLQRKRSIHSGT